MISLDGRGREYSGGEREIARAAFEAKLPLIVMRNKGFSPLFKPPGDYFAACAS